MVYAEDLKSLTRKGLWVRIPPRSTSDDKSGMIHRSAFVSPDIEWDSDSGGGRGTAVGSPCRRVLRTEGSQKMARSDILSDFPPRALLR